MLWPLLQAKNIQKKQMADTTLFIIATIQMSDSNIETRCLLSASSCRRCTYKYNDVSISEITFPLTANAKQKEWNAVCVPLCFLR